jgi:hypothetical protein
VLEDDGFVPIGRITLAGGKFVVHFDRPEARSWGPVIYAFRIGGEVVRISKGESDLASAIRGWERNVSDALRGIFHLGGTNPWEALELRSRLTEHRYGEFLARRGATGEKKALIKRYDPVLCNDSPCAKLRPPEARSVKNVALAVTYWGRLNRVLI